MAIQVGTRVVHGVPKTIPPIIGLPGERFKLKLRDGKLAVAYVRSIRGVEQWYLKDSGEFWEPFHLAGANVR
jgi:hypothetical protein